MSATLRIQDGNPIWLSSSIVPSKDTVVSPNSSPTLAAIQVTSTDVFVYVKVENSGTVDLGACSCATGPWVVPTFFQGFSTDPNATTTQTVAGVTFTLNKFGDTLSGGGINVQFGTPGSGRRAWAWSSDNRFFAYVASANGPDWSLVIIALQNITRSNGSTVLKGQTAVTTNGVFNGSNAFQYWNNSNFGWAGTKAVLAAGVAPGGNGQGFSLACPEAPTPNTWGNLFPIFSGQVDWAFLVSPCGSAVAFAPKRLNASAPPQDFFLISTATAKQIPFTKNNVPTSISSTGSNVSITTTAHASNGVTVNPGAVPTMTVTVDDPDCTFVGGGVTVWVDRVKASTLPTANLGVVEVGTAALGSLPVGKNSWVQVPNLSGWANQSEPHWCLLAQAYTTDLTTIPRAWNGQATMPPAFPVTKDNCAQRNIQINP